NSYGSFTTDIVCMSGSISRSKSISSGLTRICISSSSEDSEECRWRVSLPSKGSCCLVKNLSQSPKNSSTLENDKKVLVLVDNISVSEESELTPLNASLIALDNLSHSIIL